MEIKELINFSDIVNFNMEKNNKDSYIKGNLELIKITSYSKNYIDCGKVFYNIKKDELIIMDKLLNNCRKLRKKEYELIKEYLLKNKGFSYYLSKKRVLLLTV